MGNVGFLDSEAVEVEERISHEDQRPMFLKGLGRSHTVFIQPQELFAILIKSFHWPASQIGFENAFGSTIQAIGHQNHTIAFEFGMIKTDDETHLADGRDAHGHRKGVVDSFRNSERFASSLGDQRNQLMHLDMRAWQ